MPKNTPTMTSTMTADSRSPESIHAKAANETPTPPPVIYALLKKPPRHTNAGTVTIVRL